MNKLGEIISRIRRSPSGAFARGEVLDPGQMAYLIKKPEDKEKERQPRWLQLLRQLFSGIYTVDNLDYVQRDAYMTGFSLDMVDIPRLRYYTFFTSERPYFASIRHIGAGAFSQCPDKFIQQCLLPPHDARS